MHLINPHRFSSTGSSDLLTDLVSWWSMDETSGTRYDSHGSIDLAELGAPGYVTGKKSNAVDVDISNYLENLSAPGLDPGAKEDVSIASWINIQTASTSGFKRCVRLAQSSNYYGMGLQLFKSTDTPPNTPYCIVRDAAGTSTYVKWDTAVSTNTWVFAVATYKHSTKTLGISVDGGTPITTTHTGNGLDVTLSRIRTGGLQSSGETFIGYLDEVALWHRVLSNDDITALYNSGSGLSYSDL